MNFEVIPFKELLKKIVDNRGKTCPTSEEGIPLIATNCIKNGTLYPVYEKVRYVSQETYDTWFRSHPEPGDIVFVVKGSPGQCCWVPRPIDFCIAQDMVALRVDEKKVYPKYLFALLRSSTVQAQIANMHVGTLIPHFKKGDFDKLFLPIPDDLDYQKQVGDAYFGFCEKVEHNRQINQTLEAMAQALFKSWFVDFEPVWAKIAALETGEDPNQAAMRTISGKTDDELTHWQTTNPDDYAQLHAIASLFPEALTESELGLVPEGWEVSTVGETFKVLMGQSPSGDTYNESGNGLPFYQGRTDFGFRFPKRRIFCTEPTRIASEGEVLLSVRAPVGDLNIANEKCCIGRGVASLIHGTGSVGFTYYLLTNLKSKFESFNAEGTVFGSINQKDLKNIKYIEPTNQMAVHFANFCLSLDGNIKTVSQEIETLASLRDILLPKLLSGKLMVEEVEDAVAV